MSGKRQKKKTQLTLSNILAIIGIFLQVVQILISLASVISLKPFLGGGEIRRGLFRTVISALIILCIYKTSTFLRAIFKEYQMYKRKNEELANNTKQQHDLKSVQLYPIYKGEIWETFVANCLLKCVKCCGLLLVYIVVIILISICNPQNANAYWDNIKSMLGLTLEEENTSDVENIINSERKTEDTKETEQEVRNTKWRFILSEPTYNFALENQMKSQVFFDFNKSLTEWTDYVQDTVEQWKGEKEGVDYKTIKDEEGNNFFTYIDNEDTFKKEVENASQYIYYEEWKQNAPDSSMYDKCIAGRKKLNKIEVEGKTGCYEIWWKLANDYRYYAQEYEAQTTNADAILYYYTNSIYCCMEALKYSITEEEYNTTYHFMVTQYHDICRDECIIPQDYKAAASSIYSILVETGAEN